MSVHKPTAYGSPRSALLTVNAVAELLAISRDSVYRLVRQGELVPYRVGERLRFRPEEIDAYLERSRGAP
jgi:putative molybdopterin biosynthesis protein